jgi:hypothetical protein
MTDLFIAAVADIRRFVQPFTPLLFKVFAGLIAGRTGHAFDSAQNNLVADISFSAAIAMDAKVFGIVKCPLMIPVR